MNQKFKDYFRELLDTENYKLFLNQVAKKEDVKRALRINTLLGPNDPSKYANFKLKPLLWCPTGYFYQSKEAIGNTEAYKQGKVYSQEASSQIGVELLDVQENQLILDLCASPGSKTTQIAANANNKSFIIANEISQDRYLTLKNNLKHFGVISHAITDLDPKIFAKNYPNTFDRILADAPCSGEGMYFKFPAVLKHWNIKTIKFNARRQKKILSHAFEALKPGGKLVYSTCTLNLEENEKVVQYILKKYFGNAQLESIDMKKLGLYKKNSAKKGITQRKAKESMLKIWPHEFETGGFFAAIITKKSPTEVKDVEKSHLTSRQKRQRSHVEPLKRTTDAKSAWKICSKKEEMSTVRLLEQLTGVKNLKIPYNFFLVKNAGDYYLQHKEYYRKFQELSVRQVGLKILEGTKKTTPECLRWLETL